MDAVCKEIFKAIHEGKWLKIEYRNKANDITNYWIGIKRLDVGKRRLIVEGLHLGTYQIGELNIYIDSIQNAHIVEGTYCEVNKELIDDIAMNPERYKSLFDNIANLKVLTYLEMCHKLDTTPYKKDFELIRYLDNSKLEKGAYSLSEEQFSMIVKAFSKQTDQKSYNRETQLKMQQFAMNVLSVHGKRGLYVLAYRKLNLDVEQKKMIPEDDITVCMEFQIDGNYRESARRYMDADEYDLLWDFKANQEKIKDVIASRFPGQAAVDDMPYIIGIGMDQIVDLHSEYDSIIDMFNSGTLTFPLKAFFGDLLEKPRRIKTYPITLINKNINMDQLLAINKAMQYPTAYIQGPPGTGKTNTILNTIVTAFFNERTVLFASYNNRPIDHVNEKLCQLTYANNTIPFPVLRLGNYEVMKDAIRYINELRKRVKHLNVYSDVLDKRKDQRKEQAKQLTSMLKDYEDYLDLKEHREALARMIDHQEQETQSFSLMPFQVDLQGRQMQQLEQKISQHTIFTEQDALPLLEQNSTEFRQYLYFTSAKYIKRLEEDKYGELRRILEEKDLDKAVTAFSKYLGQSENIRKLQRVFPIMITTCISAHKLGEPEPLFDMTIIDEASQCNMAVSLMPIIRGENLMLVGDPQQLNPVIQLDEITNGRLKKNYRITDEYDYRKNSIYKAFLASDSVSDEILLHNHYRCHAKIIAFNNRKYYNSQLDIRTKNQEENPLVFVDVESQNSGIKNTSMEEVRQIVAYIQANRDKDIGVITPFVNQKEQIQKALEEEGITDVTCGTVHSFQGDEKDVIIFSAALTSETHEGTYDWLKNNQELINVATSRPKNKLIIMGDRKNIERLHREEDNDDFYELMQYVSENGTSVVSEKKNNSRALGVKPFSTQTEAAFLQNLTHALENIWLKSTRYVVQKEVAVSQVFQGNTSYDSLFYTGRFDFVVYERNGRVDIPVLAIELDGKEHLEDAAVMARDQKKNQICKAHNLQLIRVENTYARRYNYIKDILLDYFKHSK